MSKSSVFHINSQPEAQNVQLAGNTGPAVSRPLPAQPPLCAAGEEPYNVDLLSLSIVIPAFNEERRLPATLDRILRFVEARGWEFLEVLVVDDGSRDATAKIVESYTAKSPVVRLVSNPGNRGKGYAVRNGMLQARGQWRLFTDADLSAPIEELDKLVAAAKQANAKVAFGSRALDRSLVAVHQPFSREISGRIFNLIMRLLTGLPYSDTQCGFKLYHADAAKQVFAKQQIEGFGFDVEDLFLAHRLGFSPVEVPVRWSDVEGTRVSLKTGLRAFSDLLVIRWNQIQGRYR